MVRVGAEMGITKVRLTGGEPLVRRNLPELVRMVAAIDRIDDIAITTNGVLFPAMALQLKAAGLHRVNLSLDTLDPKRYRFITRFGHLEAVTRALDLALELEFHPVKVNVVIIRGFNDDEILDFCRLAA
ncbi:MAG: radical SAM protein, partial [Syntrophomonadaceae bacterium]|nr:radical SAM protein [Syntrophomonadaceae bacterium]